MATPFKSMQISLVIPAYNEEKYIGACLKLCEEYTTPSITEIVVIDNASSDRTGEIAASFPSVRVVREMKKGLTSARQCGLESTTGELIAYIDADTLPSKQWFETVQEEFEKHPEIVALSGPCDYYDLPRFQRFFVSLYWFLAMPIFQLTKAMLVGGNFIARRDALVQIGGFDTTIDFYGEDTDLARRLARIGKIRFTGRLILKTSARRLSEEGILRIGMRYVANYVSEIFLHRPMSKEHRDIR